ncbi:hypothetical protein E3Q23_03763 [Wallemia mellicola]|uniref:Winged helix DNA-binding domain-containing protein n=1 Tax=Wallemia mellicola TaxID=1708541 RepID=A0A4V4MTA0_9BASI|nr:hypothetical protein E3Q23_03763 [Wallemia mellicola]TIC08592.1 winged helix DNA-binding domain-containing protein [Wallemia mellicola]TIC08919.1 winged helix DNA-binding domain-containing protein [Wallemia mellicola]TIC24305.1 winged helix DNA-binding domain-containing protein [Wallemia mellicola]TIC25353.1 winged helix DNA-binding domain-containing protein [Wallemia mellicola]
MDDDLLKPTKRPLDHTPLQSNKKSKQGASSSFVPKLFQMVNSNTNNLITWNLAGNSFIVANLGQFSRDILPNHFKHSNFSSFVRQLNMYGFHKCNKTPRGQKSHPDHQVWEFSHPKFLKDRPELLDDIKRKVLDAQDNTDNTNTSPNKSTDLASSVALLQLNLNQSNQRLLYLEHQLHQYTCENQHLKDVVKQLYAFLYGTHGGLPFEYPPQLMPGHAEANIASPVPQPAQLQPQQPPIFITSPDTNSQSVMSPYPYSPSQSSVASPVADMSTAHSSPYASEYSTSYNQPPLSPLSLGPPQQISQRPMNLSVDTSFNLFNQQSPSSNSNLTGLGILSPSTSDNNSRRLSAHSHTYSNSSSINENNDLI